jgi:hypothetical protein
MLYGDYAVVYKHALDEACAYCTYLFVGAAIDTDVDVVFVS